MPADISIASKFLKLSTWLLWSFNLFNHVLQTESTSQDSLAVISLFVIVEFINVIFLFEVSMTLTAMS
jgi:hypothetical protein